MALAELISRVEAATGADREIDEAVEVAVRGGEAVYGQTRYTGEPTVGIKRPNANYRVGYAVEPCYPLTASLDAVLALAAEKLPGWAVDVSRYAKGNGGATLWRDGHDDFNGSAATPALALLAALLRALDAAPSRDAAGGGR